MPNRQTRRTAAKDSKPADAESVFKIKCEGVTYKVDFEDFSALDEFDFWKATGGVSFVDVFASGNPPFFAIAGMLWLHRRRHEPDLTFREVAGSLKFSDFEVDEEAPKASHAGGVEVDTSDPEA